MNALEAIHVVFVSTYKVYKDREKEEEGRKERRKETESKGGLEGKRRS